MKRKRPFSILLLVTLSIFWFSAIVSANVVIAQIGNRNTCPIRFISFTKFGFPFMLASLAVAHIYICLRYLEKPLQKGNNERIRCGFGGGHQFSVLKPH